MRRVNPKVYTKKYYLTDCTGFEEFKRSYGTELEIRFQEILKDIKITSDMKVLDIGCGRGELVFYCSNKGAKSVGIDYSNDAIKLAKEAQKKWPEKIVKKSSFIRMDAKSINFKNSTFDLVILTDVLEHLYPEELDVIFHEVNRVLKKKGKIIIHTAPNKWYVDYGYKYYSYPVSYAVVKLWNLLNKRKYPNMVKPDMLRTDSHQLMHINEPTYYSLKELFKRHKLVGKIRSTNITSKKITLSYKDSIYNIVVFFHPLSKYYPINIFLGSDFISILQKKK